MQELMGDTASHPAGTASPPPQPPLPSPPPLAPTPPKSSAGQYSMQTSEKIKPAAPQSQTPSLDGLKGQTEVSGQPAGTQEFDGSGAPLNTDPQVRMKGVSAIRAQSSVRPKTKAQTGALDSYRVRTARGLSYDFSDRDSMLRWLKDRETIEGCEVAEPGKDWVPVGQLMPVGHSTGSIPLVLEEDPAYVPEPGESVPGGFTIEGEEPQKSGAGAFLLVMWVAVALSALTLLYAAGATLTRYGVVNLSSVLPLSLVGVEFPGEEVASGSQEIPGEVIPEDPKKAYKKAIGMAKRALRSKRFSRAALEYNRALTIRPDSVEALKGLTQAYNGLGDRERALAALKKAKAQANKESAPKRPAPKEKG